jgi:lysophospholipid acyltransferase (LPLAT)-like uncharacterized protein
MTALDTFAAFCVSLVARSWRVEVVGEDHVTAVRQRGVPVLFAVWHGQLLVPLWHRRREAITLLVSAHRDGARLAHAAQRWGYRTVVGSTTRRGADGLRRLVRALEDGHDGAITPDGPRGPARIAKDGIIAAARHAGAVVVPVAASASKGWRTRSWDGFLIPQPFARVRVVYGRPVTIGANAETGLAKESLESQLAAVEQLAQC